MRAYSLINIIEMSAIFLFACFLMGCSLNTPSKNIKVDDLTIVAKESVVPKEDYKVDKVYERVNRKILIGKVHVDLPSGFDIMSEEMLAAKYPASNRPTLVYTNEDGSVNFAFNHTINQITEDKLPEVLPAFVQQFNSIYPKIQWLKKDVEKVNGKYFIIMEFITPAVDTRIYNLMYVTELDGKMLMCSFNCMESQKSEWEVKAKESLDSIEVK